MRHSSLIESMPDAGTGGAAAAGGATTSGDGSEGSRHRHRAQQGEPERPEPGSAPQQSSSGVLGESLDAEAGRRRRGQVKQQHHSSSSSFVSLK